MFNRFEYWAIAFFVGGPIWMAIWMALAWAWHRLWARVQRWAHGRNSDRSGRMGKPWLGKLVREARTGRIGFCVGAGIRQSRFGNVGASVVLQVIVHPFWAAAVDRDGFPALMAASHAPGHDVFIFPKPSEVAPALAAEAEEFRERMREEAEKLPTEGDHQ